MSDDDRVARIRDILDGVDRKIKLEDDHANNLAARTLEFLEEFSIVAAREILPAFNFYRSINHNRFRVDSDKSSASLNINIAEISRTIKLRAEPDRRQVGVSGVPQHKNDGPGGVKSTSFVTIYLTLGEITSERVKGFVDDSVEYMAASLL